MFGVIMLLGLMLMIAVLIAIGAATYFIARRLRVSTRFAVVLSVCGALVPVAALNAREMYSIHLHNDLCRNSSGRHIQAIATDVDGVRLVGDLEEVSSVSSWPVFHRYGFIEWDSGSLKWRRNGRGSAEICKVSAACNVKSFSARYELSIRNSVVSPTVTTREKQITDTSTGQVLGSEKTVYISEPTDLTMSNLLLVAWRLPQELFSKPDESCSRVDEETFVGEVLVPAGVVSAERR